MLLEFRLRNYRSFAQEAVLSLVASPDRSLFEENTAPTDVRSVPRAVRTSVVYGANASGKSKIGTPHGARPAITPLTCSSP